MFELSVAFKYLIPRWRQLSVSIISIISTLVIALVVWLIVVFFSVKDGLENSWVEKIIALTAPVRITPTEKYYKSYYYQIDSVSSASDFSTKTIGEKLASPQADPYNPDIDEEVPLHWPKPDTDANGHPKDLVQTAYQKAVTLPGYSGLRASDYETTVSTMRLRLLRQAGHQPTQQFLEHATFIGSFDADTPAMAKALLPLNAADINNILRLQSVSADNIQEESPTAIHRIPENELRDRLTAFFNTFEVAALKVSSLGWRVPKSLHDSKPSLVLPPDTMLPAQLIPDSILSAKTVSDLKFNIDTTVDGIPLKGILSLGSLEVGAGSLKPTAAVVPIAHKAADGNGIVLPPTSFFGDPVLLPRTFRESGALIGDHGYLSYFSPTPSSVQEQRIPVFIAGFYDPGIIPIGGKFVLAGRELTALIRGSTNQDEARHTNGINLRFDNIADAQKVKVALQKEFEDAGIAPYWQIATYQEYEFTKDIIQQLQSEKNLFSLISLVIIVVACSNIISMLIILVNDKKLEIGILRSMGASSGSIAAIFGICGMVMGTVGSLAGILAALLTLRYVNELVGFISRVQGHELFNPMFYGHTLPTDLSMEALTFVIITTAFISLLAGIVPAVKASMMKPSAILRAE
jgi:ABC-type transport system, involved in lipoprotein release, permease component